MNKLKSKKAAGLDNIKPESQRSMGKGGDMVAEITRYLKEVIETGIVLEGWKSSKTVMIPLQ